MMLLDQHLEGWQLRSALACLNAQEGEETSPGKDLAEQSAKSLVPSVVVLLDCRLARVSLVE